MSNTDTKIAIEIATVNLESAIRRYKALSAPTRKPSAPIVRKGATLYSVRRIAK